jgi:hypothetical protein
MLKIIRNIILLNFVMYSSFAWFDPTPGDYGKVVITRVNHFNTSTNATPWEAFLTNPLTSMVDDDFFDFDIPYLVDPSTAWDTSTPKDSSRTWKDISMSSDGQYQTAVVQTPNNGIYVSSDYGANWTKKGPSISFWSIAVSSSGQYQTAGGDNDQIYISSDYGTNWTAKDSSRYWNGVAMSSSGQYQTAVDYNNGRIYISSNYGANWTAKGLNKPWNGVAMSSDGQYQTAVTENDQIYISSNYGANWTAKDSSRLWFDVAMSSDGQYQTAVVRSGASGIYISSDYGANWNLITSGTYNDVAVSSSGQYQTAVYYNGQIYISIDYGNNWTPKDSTRQWRSVTMSSDAQYQSAVPYSGQIYITEADLGLGDENFIADHIAGPVTPNPFYIAYPIQFFVWIQSGSPSPYDTATLEYYNGTPKEGDTVDTDWVNIATITEFTPVEGIEGAHFGIVTWTPPTHSDNYYLVRIWAQLENGMQSADKSETNINKDGNYDTGGTWNDYEVVLVKVANRVKPGVVTLGGQATVQMLSHPPFMDKDYNFITPQKPQNNKSIWKKLFGWLIFWK